MGGPDDDADNPATQSNAANNAAANLAVNAQKSEVSSPTKVNDNAALNASGTEEAKWDYKKERVC